MLGRRRDKKTHGFLFGVTSQYRIRERVLFSSAVKWFSGTSAVFKKAVGWTRQPPLMREKGALERDGFVLGGEGCAPRQSRHAPVVNLRPDHTAETFATWGSYDRLVAD